MDSLKHCPFCGGPATYQEFDFGKPTSYPAYEIRCKNYQICIVCPKIVGRSKQEMKRFWNKRVNKDG